MPLRFLLDEHLRGGGLWQALQQHNAVSADPFDAVRVGDPPDLPCGSTDPEILLWAEREDRIIVTFDWHTMPGHLTAHLQAGRHSPGVLLVRRHSSLPRILAALMLIAGAGDPADYQDRLDCVP